MQQNTTILVTIGTFGTLNIKYMFRPLIGLMMAN